MNKIKALIILTLILSGNILFSQDTFASCSGITTTWIGTNSNWNTAGNWDTGSVPDTAGEDVVVTASNDLQARTNTVGCVSVASGRLRSRSGGHTLTVTGESFSAPTTDSFVITNSHNLRIDMAGTIDQTIDVVDNFDRLRISNNNTVTIVKPVRVTDTFDFTGTTTTFKINGSGEFRTDQAVTIPAGVTVEVNEGAVWYLRNNLTVNGILKVNAGGTIKIRNGRRIISNSGSIVQINGASGNAGTIKPAGSGQYLYFDLNGTFSANYFVITGLRNNGLNCTGGTISQLDNGEFRFGRTAVDYITINASCTVPTTSTGVGFYDDGGFGNLNNVDAALYSGSTWTFNEWSGEVGDDTFEVDTNNTIDWGTESATSLSLTNLTLGNQPGASTTPAEGFLIYAAIKVSLSRADTLTNITSLTVSQSGTATASDVEAVRVFADTNGNCAYNNGVDLQIGSDLTLSGSPGSATLSGITSGLIDTSSSSAASCFFIAAKISDAANDEKTLSLGIQSTFDMTNDQGYSFSDASSPPIFGNTTTISNGAISIWRGTSTNVYTANTNWLGQAPTLGNNRSCTIGLGSVADPQVTSDPIYCLNATLQASGSLDWNNTSREFNIRGSLNVESGFSFNNVSAGPGIIRMNGSANSSLTLGEDFDGHLFIENTGTSGSDNVSIIGTATINGDLTISDGVLVVGAGQTLNVNGDIIIESGGELNISAGGLLNMGNGSSLTVDTGGTLRIVGSGANKAEISASGTNSWTALINGNLNARYYTISNTNATGFVVASGATIDTTENLQDGSFLFPLGASPKMLVLQREIPGDQLDNMVFDDGGSGFSGSAVNIDTSAIGGSSDTLAIPTYSGNLSGSAFSDDPSYTVDWQNETITLKLSHEVTTPSTVEAGSSYVIASYGFVQAQAGSYNDTNITQLKITMQGSATAADISEVRTYFDADCDETGGVLIGTGSLSGSPASVTFNYSLGDVLVESDVTTPPKVCVYVIADISGSAIGGNIISFKINGDGDFVNNEAYAVDAATPTPIASGYGTISASTTTIWTGGTSTDWTNGSNWSGGVPDKEKDCEIPSASNNPTISSGAEACRSVNITSGALTIGAGATLEVYQNISNTGTISGTGQLRFEDDGTTGAHTISSSSPINALTFDMAASGSPSTVSISGTSLDLTTLTIPSGQNLWFRVTSGQTLNLSDDLDIGSGTFQIFSAGTVTFASGNTINLTGGTFKTTGVADFNDSDPDNVTQYSANKGAVEVRGAGTWGFLATSGSVDLEGFLFDEMNSSGLRIQGSTNLVKLNAGQFTSLSTSYASLNVIDINSTGTINPSASKIGFQWDSVPANTQPYTLVNTSGNGCSSGTVTFTDFFGNWFEDTTTFDVETKNTDSGCTITFGDSATAVSISSFTATGYDNAVDVEWETGNEEDHLGFNVFRANADQSNFTKVNSSIILNLNGAGNHRGRYRFIDNDVLNGEVYYYYIQNVAVNLSDNEFHGPVVVTPIASAGNPPVSGAGVNTGESDGGGTSATDPATIKNPSFKDLGDGVVILSQTSTNLRIKINPATASYLASSWDSSYEDVSIKSYSHTLQAGAPELLEREVLIEVYAYAESASLVNSTMTESGVSSHKISPAPYWSTNSSGQLVASYSEDASVYSNNALLPTNYYDLASDLITVGNRKFIKLKILPVKFNPVTDEVQTLTELVLDIGLNGNSWDQNIPDVSYKVVPSIVANNLEIDFNKTGVYELFYDDLVDSSVDFPFAGEQIADLRLYSSGTEVAIDINDANGVFDSGDSIRFYLEFQETLTDKYNKAVLTLEDFSSGASPLRVESLDGDTSDHFVSYQESQIQSVKEERDLTFLTSETVGDTGDHFFWTMLSHTSNSELDFNTTLTDLNNTIDDTVEVEITVKGRPGIRGGQKITHHLGLYVNDMTETAEEVIFDSNVRKTFTVRVDSTLFLNGVNSIRLKVFGTYAPAGDYDLVYIDHVKFNYHSEFRAKSDIIILDNEDQDFVTSVGNFSTSNINVYDISRRFETKKLSNLTLTNDDTNTVTFNTNSDNEEDLGTKYYINTDSSFLRPSFLRLTNGYSGPLHDSSLSADFIIIGHSSLLRAVDKLVEKREDEGMNVMLVETSQIYAEFNNGIQESVAINKFINYALTNWTTPRPRYLLILGDGSFDLLDHNIESAGAGARSAEYEATLPISLGTGEYFDFSSDADLTKGASFLPQMAVGRIPSNSPSVVSRYVDKVISYENGDTAPEVSKSAVFFQDIDYNLPDRFKERGESLVSLESFSNAGIDTTAYHRDDFAGAASFETQITDTFSDPPLWLNLWGHGAFDVWGDDYFFDTSFAKNLTNNKMPIVMSLSCENAYFYEDTVSEKSLGEELIFNNNGGAVVFLGSTAQTKPESQNKFVNNFAAEFNKVASAPDKGTRLGEVFYNSLHSLGSHESYRDIVRSMHILGDPTLKLPGDLSTPNPFLAESGAAEMSGGGGCSLGASNGRSPSALTGLLEYFMMALMIFGISRFRFRKD